MLVMSAKTRREREKEQRKEQILAVARALLLEKGLNATSINQIAKRAELSVGAIYFYYQSKEELYAALQMEGLELLKQMNQEAVEGKSSAEEKLRALALSYLRFSEVHKSYHDIINYFLASPVQYFSPEMKLRVDSHGASSFTIVIDVIREGIRDGVFKTVDPKRQTIIFWGSLHGLIQLKKLEKTVLAGESYRDLYLEAVEQFLEWLRR